MTVRQQAILINIVYDDEVNTGPREGAPAEWDWPALLGCEPSEVSVMLSGEIVSHEPRVFVHKPATCCNSPVPGKHEPSCPRITGVPDGS